MKIYQTKRRKEEAQNTHETLTGLGYMKCKLCNNYYPSQYDHRGICSACFEEQKFDEPRSEISNRLKQLGKLK